MGRHHVKLPDHLYLSPPSPRPLPYSLTTAASLLSLESYTYTSPAALLQGTSSTARAVGNKIPGFQASAAFLTTLRANINLDSDYPDSLSTTPDSLRPLNLASSVSSLPPKDRLHETSADDMASTSDDFAPPSALDLPKVALTEDAPDVDAAETKDPNEIPELTTFAAEDDSSRIEALRLVADSVAQQRQKVSRILIFHPFTLAALVAISALLYKYFYKGASSDLAIIGTTFAGVVMAMLVGVRSIGGGYIEEAERVGTWKWLQEGRKPADEDETGKKALGQADEILVTKFGDEYIGAIVFRGVQPVAAGKKAASKKSQSKENGTSTDIRAWTVKVRYRHKGVGTALLEDAIKIAQDKGWTKGGINLPENHANSKRVLPQMFNGRLDRADEKTRAYLATKLREAEGSGAKKGGKKRKS